MPHEPRRAIEEREVDAEAAAPEFVGRAQQRCEQQSAPLTLPDHQPSELGGRQEFDVREPLHREYVEVPRRHLARLPVPDAEHAGDAVLVACEEVQRVRLVILGVVHPRSVAVVTTEVAAQLLDVDAVPETPQLLELCRGRRLVHRRQTRQRRDRIHTASLSPSTASRAAASRSVSDA